MIKNIIAVTLIAGVVTGCTFPKHPTDEDFSNTVKKYGCSSTNEFVGKNAERVYVCNDGMKYKYSEIYKWAYDEVNKND